MEEMNLFSDDINCNIGEDNYSFINNDLDPETEDYLNILADINFDAYQLSEIISGLKSGLDVRLYAKGDYDWMQMEQLRLGLENGLDISDYSNPGLSSCEMKEIRLKLESNK